MPEASPYINHPIAVLSILSEEAAVDSTHVLCAAVLHDTIEDTETSAEELEAAFGFDVLQTVLAVTDDKSAAEGRAQTATDSACVIGQP